MVDIRRSSLETIYNAGAFVHPKVVCGLLTSEKESGLITDAHQIKNIQDRLHNRFPDKHKFTDEQAFEMDGMQYGKWADKFNSPEPELYLRGIWHTQTGSLKESKPFEPHLAQYDKDALLDEKGQPLAAAHYHLIVAIHENKKPVQKIFIWSDEAKDFVEEEIKIV